MATVLLRVCAFLLPALVGWQTATQLTARAYGFHAALGMPWCTLGTQPVYAPWAIVRWAWQWGAGQPEVFRAPLAWLYGSVLLGLLLSLACRLRTSRPTLDTYGSARFATKDELKRSGLL